MQTLRISITRFAFMCSWLFILVFASFLHIAYGSENNIQKNTNDFQFSCKVVKNLIPSVGNPRNSEGDFIRLKDGSILFVYSRYFGTSSSDHAHANLAQITSYDDGETWSEPKIIVKMDGGMNVMSVSLLRLQDGRIGLFYLRKYSMKDCREWVRFSDDEGKTWSEPTCCMPEEFIDYYVVNNARIVQLKDGTVLIPATLHHHAEGRNDMSGEALCFYSSDGCKTFQRGNQASKPTGMVFQEPGVVEMEDGSIFMYIRTTSGCQYSATSQDKGITWENVSPTAFVSPCAPLLIRPIPGTERFMAIWNESPRDRNPLTLAILDSELNFLWKTTLDRSQGTPAERFCYPAILALDNDEFLISYCAGNMPIYGLEKSRIVKIQIKESVKKLPEKG